jgi:Leucine carboxyl methyltransferase
MKFCRMEAVDNFALQFIGIPDPAQLREAFQRWGTPSPARVCAYFALRQRFSEDKLQEAIERGVRQAVLLGAGRDSLALRRPALAEAMCCVNCFADQWLREYVLNESTGRGSCDYCDVRT